MRGCGGDEHVRPFSGETAQLLRDTAREARGSLGSGRCFRTRLARGWNSFSQQAPRGLWHPASSQCAAPRAPGPVTAGPASPACGPTPCLPAPSRSPASSSPGFHLPSPAPGRARSLRPAPDPPRAAAAANEVRGRVRRFKRRLLREARREIRRCGQNPAGVRDPCRVARCGERAGVGARGEEAERRREGPAEGGSAPADMLGASRAGPGRG